MAFRTILTHVVDDRACPIRLQTTASVARALAADIIGLGAQGPWPFASAADGAGGRDFQRLVQMAREQVNRAEAIFKTRLIDPPLTRTWRGEVADPNAALAMHARAADLILAYRPPSGADTSVYASPDALVMEAGLPVLLMPRQETEFRAETVLLAWKNTREGRRAISVAMPLLTAAKRVLVAAVCSAREIGPIEAELADVERRLGRNGVNVTTMLEVDAPGAAGRRLLNASRNVGADLIVSGGYGHSRVRECVLGGVTRDLIHDDRQFVFLTH